MGGGGGGGGLGGIIDTAKNVVGGILPITGGLAGGPAGVIGNIGGLKGGEAIGNMISPQAPDAPAPPGMDPRLAAIRDKQIKEAQDFRTNLDSEKNATFRNVESASRDQLSGDISQINKNYNKRGLLYSGMREGAEAGAQANRAAGLAEAKTGINRSLEEQANEMEKQALMGGMDYWQGAKAIQDSAFNEAMQKMASRRAALGGLGSIAGSLIGAKIGSDQSAKENGLRNSDGSIARNRAEVY